jgi:hypothetical protein
MGLELATRGKARQIRGPAIPVADNCTPIFADVSDTDLFLVAIESEVQDLVIDEDDQIGVVIEVVETQTEAGDSEIDTEVEC